jgi:hypothetical protein
MSRRLHLKDAKMDLQSKLLRRDEAARFVRETYSIPCSARTLAKFASIGGGPVYRYSGRFPIYDVADLAAWAKQKIGPRVNSATEHRLASDLNAA